MITKNQENVDCPICDESFVKYKKSSQVFCSSKCWGISKRNIPLGLKGEYKECEICESKFYVPPCRKDIARFCSKKCTDIYQRSLVSKIKKTCIICLKDFYIYPSREKQSKERGKTVQYCSILCRDNDPYRKVLLIKMNEMQNKSKKLNKLEIQGNEILDMLNIEYESQYLIANKFLVDVYIKKYKIVIQWDGDYWHGHHSKLKGGIPDKRQKKRMDLDKSQDAYMRKMGIKILRFWEYEVKNKKGEVSENIKRTISDFN